MDTDVDARANTLAPEHRGMLSTLPRDPRAAARTEPMAPAETRITPIEVGSEWLRLADRFRDHNYRQLFDYAEALAARTGSTAEHLRIDHGDEPIGLASVRVKRMPGTGIAYVSGGPLVRTAANRDRGPHLDLVLKALVGEYIDRRRLVLRVSPALGDPAWNAEQERRFLAARFLHVDHLSRYRTIVVDIGGSLADVRAAFAKKWRYSLKQAEKAEISVTEGSDPALLDQFAPLFRELVARKSLSVDLGADFYGALQRALPAEERLHVAIASIGGEPASGHRREPARRHRRVPAGRLERIRPQRLRALPPAVEDDRGGGRARDQVVRPRRHRSGRQPGRAPVQGPDGRCRDLRARSLRGGSGSRPRGRGADGGATVPSRAGPAKVTA